MDNGVGSVVKLPPATERVGGRRHRASSHRDVDLRSRWGGRFLNIAAVVFVGAIGIACSRNPGPAIGAMQAASFDSIFIIVENQNFYDASVYVQFQGGSRRRLATVQAYSSDTYSVRYDPSEMWFHVDFVGARFETRSRSLSLSPGETVQLELTANAHRTGQLITRRRR